MTGEDTSTRYKTCLSRMRRKRFTAHKFTEDACPRVAGNVYTTVPPKQMDSLQHCGGENDVNQSEVNGHGVKCEDIKHNAFEFEDDEADADNDNNSTDVHCTQSCNNKRKRINSEEVEALGFGNTLPRFKRARKAVSNLNQPLLVLEKCTYQRKPKLKSKITEESPRERKETGNLQHEMRTVCQLKGEDKEELEVETEQGSEGSNADSDSGFEDKNNLQSQQDLALHTGNKDSANSQACPVCFLEFSAADSMDLINHHINNCLDEGVKNDNGVSENGFSQPSGESIREDWYFCLLCQKDLSKMNSQRRKQHVNRCCDQSSEANRTQRSCEVQAQGLNLLQCPICGKGFKASKTRQTHLKKCAQEYNVNTNQLLEIMHREQQQEDLRSTTTVATEIRTVALSNFSQQPIRVKRKRAGVTRKDDLDEETQIALALSASMAPPPPPGPCGKKDVKGKGKKKKGNNELPPLLLRDNDSAQKAVAIRAAQVLCTWDKDDDEDEISCTPALAPSRLAENIPGHFPLVSICDVDDNFGSASTSDCKEDGDNPVEDIKIDDGENSYKGAMDGSFGVDPALSKSFLNFLYNAEIEEKSEEDKDKVPHPSPLWSLAALKKLSSATFIVPGLLPPSSPQKEKKVTKTGSSSETARINEHATCKMSDSGIDGAEILEDRDLVKTKEQEESGVQDQMSRTTNKECTEVTPSQAVDVELLLELVQDDGISNKSLDSQPVIAASGFCIDQEEDIEGVSSEPSGVPKLLNDLSSMINNSFLSDVTIKLQDGHEMVAHSFILALRSEVLGQLLLEKRALCEETTCSGSGIDKVCLQFDDVRQSVFDLVLRHIYTGDISIPGDSELDETINLAERFKLPCLLKACLATREQLSQACESERHDGMVDSVALHLDELEENLWKDEDELSNNFQSSENKLDEENFLNDDDIEEIMIFQTQSLRRKGSIECQNFEQRPSPLLVRHNGNERVLATGAARSSREENPADSRNLSFSVKEKIEISFQEDGLSYNPTEKGRMSHSQCEKRKLSRDPYEKDNLVLKPDDVGNLSRNQVVTVNSSHSPARKGSLSQEPNASVNLSYKVVETCALSRNSAENRESSLTCDLIEREEMDVLSTMHGKRDAEEDLTIEYELHGEESPKAKQLPRISPLGKSVSETSAIEFEENLVLKCGDGQLSCNSKEKEVKKSCPSCTEQACVLIGEPISDSDHVEALHHDYVQSDDELLSMRKQLERDQEGDGCHVSDGLSDRDDAAAADIDCESESNPDFINVSMDLLNDDLEEVDGNGNKLAGADKIPGSLSDFPSLPSEGFSANFGLPLPAREKSLDDEQDLQGSPREVTFLEDDEGEETAVNGSITLISDNDDEVDDDQVPDVSPPTINLTIVPETPRVSRSLYQSKSSSADSFSEDEDDVSLTGSSPSKARRTLKDEANNFLFKLKERVGRSKGKNQGKGKSKESGEKKESPRGRSVKHVTPTKRSPHGRQESRGGTSLLLKDFQATRGGFQPQDSSLMGHSPRDYLAGDNSPMHDLPMDFENCTSPIWEQQGFASDDFTTEQSPAQSPVLVQRDSTHASKTNRTKQRNASSQCVPGLCGRNCPSCENDDTKRLQKRDCKDPVIVEMVDYCADKTNENCGDALGSSSLDVMSPPVPSPDFSFLESHLRSGSPSPSASAHPQKIVLSPDPAYVIPANRKSPVSERGLCAGPQSDSPGSPSVCSFTSQRLRKDERVKKLDLGQSLNDKETTETVKVASLDPSIPLMERIRAARNGARKICLLTNADEDSSESSSDDNFQRDKNESEQEKLLMVFPQLQDKKGSTVCEIEDTGNISIDADFDFYDDGGYNFDIVELNNLETCLEDGKLEANLEKHEPTHSKDAKVPSENKGIKDIVRMRKVSQSQERVEDSDVDKKKTEALKKRGKKTDSQSQTVGQPVTPMPNYYDMNTPTLKSELHKFGVRPLGKKKMILKLKEIYDYTHQVEPPPLQASQMDGVSGAVDSLSCSVVGSHDSEEVGGGGTGSSDDSSNEEDTEFGDCTVMIEDEAATASQQVNGGDLKQRLVHYIQSNPEMYKKILKFEPMELVSLHQNIKSDGISCSLGKLVDFLDEQCITFTTAGSRTRAPRKRGGKKKNNQS